MFGEIKEEYWSLIEPEFYENMWHDRVKNYLEMFFVPMLSDVEPSDGFIICYNTINENSLPADGLPIDFWCLVENWKFMCEYSIIPATNVRSLLTGEAWVSELAMETARNISVSGLNENIKNMAQE